MTFSQLPGSICNPAVITFKSTLDVYNIIRMAKRELIEFPPIFLEFLIFTIQIMETCSNIIANPILITTPRQNIAGYLLYSRPGTRARDGACHHRPINLYCAFIASLRRVHIKTASYQCICIIAKNNIISIQRGCFALRPSSRGHVPIQPLKLRTKFERSGQTGCTFNYSVMPNDGMLLFRSVGITDASE